jgi:circadian clock protein KaiC
MFNAAITIGTIATNPSDEGISSMVDTWLMLEDTKVNNKRASSFYVMKSRGMNHSKNEMIFLLNENGVELLEKNAIQNNKVIKENKNSHTIAEI